MPKRIDAHGVLGPRGVRYSWVYGAAALAALVLLVIDIFDDSAIWNYGVIACVVVAILARPGGVRGASPAPAPDPPARTTNEERSARHVAP